MGGLVGGRGSERQKCTQKNSGWEKGESADPERSCGYSFAIQNREMYVGLAVLKSSGMNLNSVHTCSQLLFAEPKKFCLTTAGLVAQEHNFTKSVLPKHPQTNIILNHWSSQKWSDIYNHLAPIHTSNSVFDYSHNFIPHKPSIIQHKILFHFDYRKYSIFLRWVTLYTKPHRRSLHS